MKINICTGYPLDSPRGNTTTALRLEKRLLEAGYQAVAMHTDTPPPADVQVSLHLLKTSAASIYFAQNNPNGRLFIRLTGTDINGGFHQNPKLSQQVVDLSEKLIVAHAASLPRIPERWRQKVVVVHPSIQMPQLPEISLPAEPFFVCIGHLRPVKNPHLMFAALQQMEDCKVAAVSVGNAYDVIDSQQARINTRKDSRYRWVSGADRATAIAWTRSALASINSSHSEGGANSVIEAIVLGVPVLASRIDGNLGFLGEDYLGYFDPDRSDQLASLMQRCLVDDEFVNQLERQITTRQPLFSAEREILELKRLISSPNSSEFI